MRKVLISACLLGINCKYNGMNNLSPQLIEDLKKADIICIPVCPEQLGGLSTPRKPCEITLDHIDKIIIQNEEGIDVTLNFLNGVDETIKLLDFLNIQFAILKEKSPSCGSHVIYDGTFSHTLIKGQGVLTRKLLEKGIRVIGEDDDYSMILNA